MPVYSNVIYFHPRAGRKDAGSYAYNWNCYEYARRYKVIRLIKIEGSSVLEQQAPGMLPFTPLMKPISGMDSAGWVQECVDATMATSVDQGTQADLLCALSLFGSVVNDPQLFKRLIPEELIPEELMIESKYYQLLREEFIAQGIE